MKSTASNNVGLKDLELVMELEDEFGIDLPDARLLYSAEQLKLDPMLPLEDPTVGEIHSRLCDIMAERGRSVPGDSWLRVQKRVMRIFDVSAEEIRPGTKLYADLGASS